MSSLPPSQAWPGATRLDPFYAHLPPAPGAGRSERELYPWSEFRDHLIVEIAAAERPELPAESRPTYYECWLAAFEALLIDKGVLTKAKIDTRAGWLARAALPSRSRSLLHLRWAIPEEDDEV